jgi:hypothetical protein
MAFGVASIRPEKTEVHDDTHAAMYTTAETKCPVATGTLP